jgi:hypothetical protein
MKLFLLLVISFVLLVAVFAAPKLLMEKQILRSSFKQVEKSDPNLDHEVVISIQKKNLDILEDTVLERATPGNAMYQQWMTYDEVGKLIENVEGFEKVKGWLEANGIEIKWVSNRKDYIKAVSKISTWESLLDAKFYKYEDLSLPENPERPESRIYHRSLAYSIPEEYKESIFAIFNTVQTPPAYKKKYHVRKSEKYGTPFRTDIMINVEDNNLRGSFFSEDRMETESYNGKVTVSFLNSYYHITFNNGSSSISQSVFETSTEYFSQSDLTQFQTQYGLTIQSAESVGNHQLTSCPIISTPTKDCYEGNLDIQYIMGVAQKVASIYWWVTDTSNTDPFVAWLTAIADESNPPLSNSASWGAVEQV